MSVALSSGRGVRVMEMAKVWFLSKVVAGVERLYEIACKQLDPTYAFMEGICTSLFIVG